MHSASSVGNVVAIQQHWIYSSPIYPQPLRMLPVSILGFEPSSITILRMVEERLHLNINKQINVVVFFINIDTTYCFSHYRIHNFNNQILNTH